MVGSGCRVKLLTLWHLGREESGEKLTAAPAPCPHCPNFLSLGPTFPHLSSMSWHPSPQHMDTKRHCRLGLCPCRGSSPWLQTVTAQAFPMATVSCLLGITGPVHRDRAALEESKYS